MPKGRKVEQRREVPFYGQLELAAENPAGIESRNIHRISE